MKYYCRNCKREYEDLSFKYCPVCLTKIIEKPFNYENKNIQENLDPRRKEIFDWLYELYDGNVDNLREMYKDYNYSSEEDLINISVDMQYSDEFKKGLDYTESKDFKKAIECYGKATKDCQTEVAWINKALNHLFLNEPSEILICADEALKIHPQCSYAFYCKSCAYLLLNDYKLAVDVCNEGLAFDSENFNLWANKTMATFSLGYLSDALEYCDKALSLKTNNEEVKNQLIGLRNQFRK